MLSSTERQGKKHEDLEAKQPWNPYCDHGALRVAYDALVEDDPQAVEGLEGMTSRSLEVMLELRPACIDHVTEEKQSSNARPA